MPCASKKTWFKKPISHHYTLSKLIYFIHLHPTSIAFPVARAITQCQHASLGSNWTLVWDKWQVTHLKALSWPLLGFTPSLFLFLSHPLPLFTWILVQIHAHPTKSHILIVDNCWSLDILGSWIAVTQGVPLRSLRLSRSASRAAAETAAAAAAPPASDLRKNGRGKVGLGGNLWKAKGNKIKWRFAEAHIDLQ